MEINNLHDLYDAITDLTVELTPDLPTWGPEIENVKIGVWSWDETRVMVGSCPDDLILLKREDSCF